jgi:hypothetical protein
MVERADHGLRSAWLVRKSGFRLRNMLQMVRRMAAPLRRL